MTTGTAQTVVNNYIGALQKKAVEAGVESRRRSRQ